MDKSLVCNSVLLEYYRSLVTVSLFSAPCTPSSMSFGFVPLSSVSFLLALISNLLFKQIGIIDLRRIL